MNILLFIIMILSFVGVVVTLVLWIIDANRDRVLNKLRKQTDEERNEL